MVMDRNNRSHRAKGLPQGVAGTYDATASAGGDDVRPPDAAPAPDADAGRLWLDDVLRATVPRTNPDGTVADYRDEPVLQPAEEIRMVDRMAHGRILRGLKPWFPNEADASELAYRIASDRLMALRRSCAADPSKCYSPRLAQYALGRPVRMEAILSNPPTIFPRTGCASAGATWTACANTVGPTTGICPPNRSATRSGMRTWPISSTTRSPATCPTGAA